MNKNKGTLRISPKNPPKKKGKTDKPSTKKNTHNKKSSKRGGWTNTLVASALLLVLLGLAYYLFSRPSGHCGIDVSHHQGVINWKEVGEKQDLEFAFLKATEGVKMTDDTFTQNLHGARNAKLKVGAYHFFLPNVSGKKQFEHFADVVGNDIDLKPVLDLEPAERQIIHDEDYRVQVKAFIEACVSYYGCHPIVYASPSFLKDHALETTVNNCPYWMAWYHDPPFYVRSRRKYLMKNYPGTQAVMWQYANDGKHVGIKGKVDLDECWEMGTIIK